MTYLIEPTDNPLAIYGGYKWQLTINGESVHYFQTIDQVLSHILSLEP